MFLFACTGTVINSTQYVPVPVNKKIAVISFANNTETPMAGERAKSITGAALKSRGFCHVMVYHSNEQTNVLLPGTLKAKTREEQIQWARRKGAQYVMTGSVNEWTYKVGLDGEPVVGLSIQLIDLSSNRTVWSAVGSKSGGSRIAVTTIAQELINAMLIRLCPSVKQHGKS